MSFQDGIVKPFPVKLPLDVEGFRALDEERKDAVFEWFRSEGLDRGLQVKVTQESPSDITVIQLKVGPNGKESVDPDNPEEPLTESLTARVSK